MPPLFFILFPKRRRRRWLVVLGCVLIAAFLPAGLANIPTPAEIDQAIGELKTFTSMQTVHHYIRNATQHDPQYESLLVYCAAASDLADPLWLYRLVTSLPAPAPEVLIYQTPKVLYYRAHLPPESYADDTNYRHIIPWYLEKRRNPYAFYEPPPLPK